MRKRTHLASLLLVVGLAAPAASAPTGTIEVKATGTRYEDVEYEIDGNLVHAQTKFGKATFNRGDVVIYESTGPKPGAEEQPEEGEGGQVEVPGYVDLLSRCALEPPPEWEVVSRSSPLVRVQLRHQTRDAQLIVTARPAVGEWSFDTRAHKSEPDDIVRDLNAQYAKVQNPRPEPQSLWGAQVYRIPNVKVTEFGEAQQEKTLHEVRFRRFGLEYAVSLLVGRADQGALQPHVDELLQAFTFLAPLSEKSGTVVDFTRGYGMASPGGDWKMISRPFEDEIPLRFSYDDGRSEVWVQMVKGKGSASDIVGDLIADRRKNSTYFQIGDQGKAVRDGVEVVTFTFEDFREKGRNVRQAFRGFAAQLGEQGLLFVGRAPLTDDDKAKLQADVNRSLDGVRLFDLPGLMERVSQAQNALALVSSGYKAWSEKRFTEAVDRLTQALELVPDYSRAYYLRALARKDNKDFDGFKADLQQASQLDPDGGYDAVLGPSYAEESELEAKNKNWERAAELRLKAWRSTKDDKHLTPWLTCLRGIWTDRFAKEKEFDRGLKDQEGRVKDLLGRKPVADHWARLLREGIVAMIRDQDFSHARRWVNKLRRLDGDPRARTDADAYSKQIADGEARGKKGG